MRLDAQDAFVHSGVDRTSYMIPGCLGKRLQAAVGAIHRFAAAVGGRVGVTVSVRAA